MVNPLDHIRSCFQPRQWFISDGEPDPFIIADEDSFMWVYKQLTDGSFEVGFFTPDGHWMADSSHTTRESAASRVNYLNGGKRA